MRPANVPDTFVRVAVVSVLALGIGVSTAIFGVVNAVLCASAAVRGAGRLSRLVADLHQAPGGTLLRFSPGKFYDWQRDARSFEGMAMYQCCGFRELALTGTGTARTVRATAVTRAFSRSSRAPTGRSDASFGKMRTRQAAGP